MLHNYELIRQHIPNSILLARKLVAQGQTKEIFTEDNIAEMRSLSHVWEGGMPL